MTQPEITKDTQLCVSIAAHPGNFGTLLFNAAFKHLQLDFLYKALHLPPKPNYLKNALGGLKVLDIRGCGISMPFKVEAVKYVDSLDKTAAEIGAINTIVNTNHRLKGYNTDYYGALDLLSSIPQLSRFQVTLLGAGGAARAISAALNKLKPAGVTITSHQSSATRSLARSYGFTPAPWHQRHRISGDLLINATPVGMNPRSQETPFSARHLSPYQAVMDVVISPLTTRLMLEAKQQGKILLPGYRMALHQAAKQFFLYTRQPAPIDLMEKIIKNIVK